MATAVHHPKPQQTLDVVIIPGEAENTGSSIPVISYLPESLWTTPVLTPATIQLPSCLTNQGLSQGWDRVKTAQPRRACSGCASALRWPGNTLGCARGGRGPEGARPAAAAAAAENPPGRRPGRRLARSRAGPPGAGGPAAAWRAAVPGRACLPGTRNTCCRALAPSPQSTPAAMPLVRSRRPQASEPWEGGLGESPVANGGRRVDSGERGARRDWRGPEGGPRGEFRFVSGARQRPVLSF